MLGTGYSDRALQSMANGNGVYLDFRSLLFKCLDWDCIFTSDALPTSMERTESTVEHPHSSSSSLPTARVSHPPLPPLIYKREANVNPYLTAAKSVPIFSTPLNACIIV